jgi:hypothetical protein
VFIAALAVAAPAPTAVTPEAEARLQALLGTILTSPDLGDADVGVHVRSLSDGRTLFSRNATKLMNPASNVKLVTTAAALWHLGANYRFKTVAYRDGALVGDKVQGNLWIEGFGDPTLTDEQLFGLVNEIALHGIAEVKDLVIDDTFFDAVNEGPGWGAGARRSLVRHRGGRALHQLRYLHPARAARRRGGRCGPRDVVAAQPQHRGHQRGHHRRAQHALARHARHLARCRQDLGLGQRLRGSGRAGRRHPVSPHLSAHPVRGRAHQEDARAARHQGEGQAAHRQRPALRHAGGHRVLPAARRDHQHAEQVLQQLHRRADAQDAGGRAAWAPGHVGEGRRRRRRVPWPRSACRAPAT